MWGIIPAAGLGSRIQPLAFSKELLPVGSRIEDDVERPRAVSEYLIERMTIAGATKLCFVISPGKWDILEYYGSAVGNVKCVYVVQDKPLGLCDALFRAAPLVAPDEQVVVGLPDTIWLPRDALQLPNADALSLVLFPVTRPELFDSVVMNDNGQVMRVDVKREPADSSWIWGAFRASGRIFIELCELWKARNRRDVYFGHLVNAYLQKRGAVCAIKVGTFYVDVGTVHGYREAMRAVTSLPEFLAR